MSAPYINDMLRLFGQNYTGSSEEHATYRALDAVLAEYEKRLREQVAAEILADVEPFFAARLGADMWEAAYRAASIARGER